MTEEALTLGRDDLKAVIREAIREELFAVGLRADEQAHVEAARRDFFFLRRLREATEGTASRIGMAIMLSLVTGLLTVLWFGLKGTVK